MEKELLDIIARLKEIVEQSGLSYVQLEKKTGIAKSSIQRYVNGETQKIPIDSVSKIARACGSSARYVMGWETQDGKKSFPGAMPTTGIIPVYGAISAGFPALADQYIEDQIVITLPNPEEYFALRVSGTSMINAGITDGCRVVIHKQSVADNGDIVACRLNGDEATLKRFRQQGSNIMLLPENPDFEPLIVPASDFEDGSAEIIGVVRQIVIDV